MDIVDDFFRAKQAIYDHVGFKEDYVIYPFDDRRDMYWSIDDEDIRYAETMEKFNSDGDYYVDTLYTQRFYRQWIYRGEKYTMIFCDTNVDGMKYFALFDNEKEVKTEDV